MTPPLLQLRGVHTHIAAYHILHGVDLTVPEGQVTMLLGRNGAGKTTTLRTIMGLWKASQGELHFRGRRLDALATPDIAAAGIAYVPESMGIFTDLTVKENMVLAARSARHEGELDRADGPPGKAAHLPPHPHAHQLRHRRARNPRPHRLAAHRRSLAQRTHRRPRRRAPPPRTRMHHPARRDLRRHRRATVMPDPTRYAYFRNLLVRMSEEIGRAHV